MVKNKNMTSTSLVKNLGESGRKHDTIIGSPVCRYNPPVSRNVSVTSFAQSFVSSVRGGMRKINQYNLCKKIGEGAFGSVFKAID
jgi:serine/threonine protein kinase